MVTMDEWIRMLKIARILETNSFSKTFLRLLQSYKETLRT